MNARRYLITNYQQNSWDRVPQRELWLTAVSVLLLLFLCGGAHADGVVDGDDEYYESLADVGTGAMVVATEGGYQGLLRMGAELHMQVSGMVVHAEVKQHFQNDSRDWVEATYVFPLPSDSAVNSMRIRIGERVIEGEIKERQQARRLFVKAKQQGKQAGLMEQQRPNLFTTKVANIGPGERIEVEFSYLQTLRYVDQSFSLRIPLTLTPRYIPGLAHSRSQADDDGRATVALGQSGWAFATDEVPDAAAITPPQVASVADSQSHRARITVDLTPGFELAEVVSSYHAVTTQRLDSHYRIQPKQNPLLMNRDFVLTWRPVPHQAPTAALFRETKAVPSTAESEAVQHHGLLMLMPPQQAGDSVVQPRELLIVIDTSGSMAGASMPQAKQAVLMALDRLRPNDRFNVIAFDSSYQVLFADSVPADQGNLQNARRFVQGLKADGGTEMYGALHAAFRFPKLETHLRQVVFITDGSVGNEKTLFELIHQELGRSRLYTVGIGSAPNEFFMRKAAEFGKGTYAMIGAHQEVQAKMSALFNRIEKPVLTNIAITHPGARGETFPQVIPDLYQGEPLVIHTRFSQWPDQLAVTGTFAGKPWNKTITQHCVL